MKFLDLTFRLIAAASLALGAAASSAGEHDKGGPWACAPGEREPSLETDQFKALQDCVRQGNAASMFLLANRTKDKQFSRELLLRAAELDHPESLYQLGLEEKDPKLSAQYMKAAAHALKHRH